MMRGRFYIAPRNIPARCADVHVQMQCTGGNVYERTLVTWKTQIEWREAQTQYNAGGLNWRLHEGQGLRTTDENLRQREANPQRRGAIGGSSHAGWTKYTDDAIGFLAVRGTRTADENLRQQEANPQRRGTIGRSSKAEWTKGVDDAIGLYSAIREIHFKEKRKRKRKSNLGAKQRSAKYHDSKKQSTHQYPAAPSFVSITLPPKSQRTRKATIKQERHQINEPVPIV
ncbi:hypothetical protein C8R44DRAFT_912918 [Mycena epipterygia]|nr:hypothetical protein C8R44DRAFT_912918 [Mycena epipterygia]